MGENPHEPRGNQQDVIDSVAACTSVDAGAGTGKTTTMLMRLEQAIERGDIDPADVLVLTFANEAASSIRAAVSDRLDPETAAAIDSNTYHSFCYGLVREYAYYLGYSPEFDVVTERTRRRIVGRLLAENEYDFATTMGRGEPSPDDVTAGVDRFIQSMSQEDITPDQLDDQLPAVRTLELCHEFVLWLEETAEERLSFDNEALRYFNRDEHLDGAESALVDYGKLITFCREKIAEAPAAFRGDEFVREIDHYLTLLQQSVTNAIDALSLEEPTTKQLPRALFGNEIWRGATGRLEQSPFGRLKHYVEFVRLARHYTAVYADYHAALEDERMVDFDELVRTATTLVTDDGVADEITSQWTQVYCDEFQDTDRTQFRLITELTDGPDRPDLLAIGDKDQSIYGWRGTDREGLDRLATVYDDHESYELELNFRSKQEILALTNNCDYGSQASKTLREADRATSSEPTDEPDADSLSEPVLERDRDLESPSGGERRGDESAVDRVVKVESDEIDRSTAEQVGTTVSRLLNGDADGVPQRSLEDIAVIVRTNRHAQAVAAELHTRQLPYELSGSTYGEVSPGLQTLLSYFRVLVDPDADAHLRRVLLYRYRVTEADLATLQRRDGTLYDAVMGLETDADAGDDTETRVDADLESSLEQPDRVHNARTHLEELETLRDVYPLSGFVGRFREVTRLEWYCTSDERDELGRLERFVESYNADSVVQTVTPAFVDALERTLESGSSDRTRGTQSTDSIDVMTVHQAKGLEFDTVLVPYLSDEEWCVERDYARRARYQLLAATLDDDIDSPLCADLAAETVGEEWRVLHVALTRAENHLFVFGSTYDYDGEDEELGASTADACLADGLEWSVTGEQMNLWESLTESFERVRESFPETVADRTDEIADSADRTPGTITYYSGYDDRTAEPLETRTAIETVHDLGRLLREGTLLPAADAASATGDDGVSGTGDTGSRTDDVRATETAVETPSSNANRPVPSERQLSSLSAETVRFPVDTLANATDVPAALRHSYTSLATHETCSRKHYLDHVVHAIDDSSAQALECRTTVETRSEDDWNEPADTAVPRLVGTVFHDVAEEAFYRNDATRNDWRAVAIRQLTARGVLQHRERVLSCVDRYFDASAPAFDDPVHEWEPLAAEVPFTLADVPNVRGDVVGFIDSVRRTPEGDLVVLDYKATAERILPSEASQLALYVRACEQAFDEPVTAAGYVYVGPVDGPRVDLFSPDDLPPWSSVHQTLEAADDPSFAETTTGEHCQYCPHRSLGCAPEEYIDDHLETEPAESAGDD